MPLRVIAEKFPERFMNKDRLEQLNEVIFSVISKNNSNNDKRRSLSQLKKIQVKHNSEIQKNPHNPYVGKKLNLPALLSPITWCLISS